MMEPAERSSLNVLRDLPLFQALDAGQIQGIAAQAQKKSLRRGQILFQQGDAPQGFYVVVSGQIKLGVSSASGQEKIVELIAPGQSFGEAVMFMESRPYPVFAMANAPTRLLHIPQKPLFDMLANDPHFARLMLAGMARRLHQLIADIEAYSLRSGAQRLIGFLLRHQHPAGTEAAGEIRLELPASKQDIASRMNIAPETLSRILHDLTQSGILTVQGRTLIIHSPERLRAYG